MLGNLFSTLTKWSSISIIAMYCNGIILSKQLGICAKVLKVLLIKSLFKEAFNCINESRELLGGL